MRYYWLCKRLPEGNGDFYGNHLIGDNHGINVKSLVAAMQKMPTSSFSNGLKNTSESCAEATGFVNPPGSDPKFGASNRSKTSITRIYQI